MPARPGTVLLLPTESFVLRYPNGSRDSEALFVDPSDGAPYIVGKEGGKTTDVWRVPMPLKSSGVQTLVHVAKIPLSDAKFSAADVSPDGRRIYLRNKDFVYYYERKLGKTVAQALTSAPCNVWAGGQGNAEALAISADGLSMITTSEGRASKIYEAIGTMPSPGPKTVPSYWAFGSGLRGSGAETPMLGAISAPILGHRAIQVAGFGARASSVAVILLSTVAFQDGVVGFAGGWLHAQPDFVVPAVTDTKGRSALSLGVLPAVPPLLGLRLALQSIVVDAAAPKGFALSPGLYLQLDA